MTINPKQAREFLGLSQTDMAKAMGVSRGLWLKWERQEQGMTAAPTRFLQFLIWLQSKDMLDIYFTFLSEFET